MSAHLNSKVTGLLNKFRSGEISPAEFQELKSGINGISDSELKEMMYSEWDRYCNYEPLPDEKIEELYSSLHITGKETKPRFTLSRYWIQIAASLLFIIAGSLTVLTYMQNQTINTLAEQNVVIRSGDYGKSLVTLPDGTIVHLNAKSSLTYSQDFGREDRKVKLSGEGFFEVKKNAKLPFAIHTRELDVTVLGTKFNFRNYPEDETAVVDLLEGKVALDNHVQPMETRYLAPAEKMVLNKATGEMEIIAAEVEKAKIWTDDVLLFDEEFLPDIAVQLERYYDVKIILANPALETARFYGRFNRQTQSIYDVLNILSSTGRVSYVVKGDTIILK